MSDTQRNANSVRAIEEQVRNLKRNLELGMTLETDDIRLLQVVAFDIFNIITAQATSPVPTNPRGPLVGTIGSSPKTTRYTSASVSTNCPACNAAVTIQLT